MAKIFTVHVRDNRDESKIYLRQNLKKVGWGRISKERKKVFPIKGANQKGFIIVFL